MNINENFESLDEEVFTKYAGQWIAAIDGKVVAHGNSLKEIYNLTKKEYPKKEPLFGKLPERTLTILSF